MTYYYVNRRPAFLVFDKLMEQTDLSTFMIYNQYNSIIIGFSGATI